MIAEVSIRDSISSDCLELMKTMRQQDIKESLKQDYHPYTALKYSFDNAVHRKTAEINGIVSAMWGVVGDILTDTGTIYLVTGKLVETISTLKFVRIYRQELQNMLKIFPKLQNKVDSEYKESVKLLQLSGFTLEPADEKGLQKFYMKSYN